MSHKLPRSVRAHLRVGVLAGLVLTLSAPWGAASTIRFQSDAELIAASARIVRGRVLSTRGERGARGRIYTVTTVEVLEDFSGVGESIVEIRELGGSVGNDFLYVGGAAHYQPGSEIVVCLERAPGGWLRSVSLAFSKFDVIRGADGDAVLRRNLADTIVVGSQAASAASRLSSFRELAERVRRVRSVAPARAGSGQQTAIAAEPFTHLRFSNGLPTRWIEPDSGTPVRWYIDTSAPPPVPGNASAELQSALAGWTNPPGASIVLTYAGMTDQDSSDPIDYPSLGDGAGVVFFEDPDDEINGSVLALGGGFGSFGGGGTVNGTNFNRLRGGFVIFQNAADLPFNYRQSRDFSRVLEHEIGHGIGLGHSDSTTSNIMFPSCCSASTPIPPAIGPDDLAGLTFIYPVAAECTYSISPESNTVAALSSSFSVNVSTQADCSWNVSGVPSWISPAATSGTGNSSVQLSISTNSATSPRAATLVIGGRTLSVTQLACAASVDPTSTSVPARAGSLTVSVSSGSCQWTASSPVPWITVTGGSSGSGSGTVTLAVARNISPARSAVLTVAGRSVTVTQLDGTRTITSDFNGDGRTDLVWHHQVDGRISIWHMNGIVLQAGTLLTPDRVADTNWKIAGVWDPNGDGNPDLLWRHQLSGNLATWRMNGTTQVSGGPLTPGAVADTAWEIVATADLDRDGDTDLVWQHATQGLISAWLMNGTTMVEGRLLSPSTVADTNWRIAGSGDFDQDGHADLVWQHRTSGQASVWFMNGTTLVRGTVLSPAGVADTNWQIRAIADLNGDEQPDLVWQNIVTGYLAAWLMNGTTMVDGIYLSPSRVADTGWRISAPR